MKKIIFDCDNTFGVDGCDVDDGLALLYLLGNKDANLLGITATYGNSNLDIVYETTARMLKELRRTDISIIKGGRKAGDYNSPAACWLAQMAADNPGEITILATGSLTNLYGAYQRDSSFYENVKEIVLMGGITGSLVFKKKIMKELNFSCDPAASYNVLTKGRRVSILTGNNCLGALFTKEEYKRRLFDHNSLVAEYIRKKTDYWFRYNEEDYGIEGFYNWDVTAAVFMMHPEIFDLHPVKLSIHENDLERGYLREDSNSENICCLPQIKDEAAFKENIYKTWLQVPL